MHKYDGEQMFTPRIPEDPRDKYMSESSSNLKIIVEPIAGIIEQVFPQFSERQQKIIAMWLIFMLIIIVLLIVSYLLAKEKFYIPLFVGLALVILSYFLVVFLAGSIDIGKRKASKRDTVNEFLFVNRDYEKEYILGRHLNYCLIDAPAGYGKTALLNELAEGFRDGGWQTAHAVIEREDHFGTFLTQVADALNLDSVVVHSGLDSRSRMSALIHAIKKKWENGSDSPGLVLLVDFDNNPAYTVLEELVIDLIPGIQESLRILDSFRKKRFRVVIAGRCIASFITKHSSIPIREFMLSPFSYRYVKESVENYLTTEDRDSISQLAAHTMHLSGGHPECMQKIIKEYAVLGNSPDDFIETHRENIWKDIVNPTVLSVRDAIPRRLCKHLDILSIFRYLDEGILKELIKKKIITEYGDAHDLADELTSTFLLSRDGRLLKDSITRRLLSLRLLKEIGSAEFETHCKQAYSICLKKLQKPETQMPEKWALEALFQYLQKHASFVHSPTRRAAIRLEFFDKSVPEVIPTLFDGRNKREESLALLDALEKDWEFRFTMNYFLRENQYMDDPYQEFMNFIEQNYP